MTILDGFLRSVPSDADQDDGRLFDPTVADSSASHQITPVGIASAEALGQVALNGTIAAVGLASAEALGAVGLNSTIAPAGVASAAQAGSPAVGARIATVGIASAEQLGTVGLQGTIAPVSIASAAALGAPGLNGTIAPAGVGSSAAVGRPTIQLPHQILAVGVASAERSGQPRVGNPGDSISGTFGSVQLERPRPLLRLVAAPVLLMPAGIPSAARVGRPTIDTSSDRWRQAASRHAEDLFFLEAA